MDFLDPHYRRQHMVRLFTGYVLVAIAILLAATMLLLLAYGFKISKNGQVVQNGLVFVSSKPSDANVLLDGVSIDKTTNTRLNIPEGSYQLQLQREGYRDWRHAVNVIGGRVMRYDYPLLFPESLDPSVVKNYGKQRPGLSSISPDKRWLLVQPDKGVARFDIFDLRNPEQDPDVLLLPTGTFNAGGQQQWSMVDWASNNTHVLLAHTYGKAQSKEFILLNRENDGLSINLNSRLSTNPTELKLQDDKFDRYYLYSAKTKSLQTATLAQPTAETVLKDVLEYDTYGSKNIVYVTPDTVTKSRSKVNLYDGVTSYTLRYVTRASNYHVALSSYADKSFVAVASTNQDKVFVYKDPIARLKAKGTVLVPIATLRIKNPTYLSFSVSGRFVVAQRGLQFATYDAEYKLFSRFTMTQPMDAGQKHAVWMDGAHLQYVTNKQVYVFDFDGKNKEILVPALSGDAVFYDTDYTNLYALAQDSKTKLYSLSTTPLRTPADQ